MRNVLIAAAALLAFAAPARADSPLQVEMQRIVALDYAATPATRELALELLRVRCLGMTADGSRQLRPEAPVARNSNVNRNPASAPDELSMFQQDMRAVPPQ
jgi:hypothetical protein